MTEVLEKMGQFQVVDAGPIQVKRVKKAIDALHRAHHSFISKFNPDIVMTRYDLGTPNNQEYIKAFNAIGVRFAWWIRRDNVRVIQEVFEKAAAEKMANLPKEK